MKRLLAGVRVDVLAPLKVTGRPYAVGLGVTHIGRSSFTYAYGVYDGDESWPRAAPPACTSTRRARHRCPTRSAASWSACAWRRRSPPRGRRSRTAGARDLPFRVDVRARFGDLDTTGTSTTSRSRAGTSTPSPSCTSTCSATPPAARSTASPELVARRLHRRGDYPAIHQLRVGVVELDETSVRYACGLFDGPRCIGLAEATGGLSPDEDPELGSAWPRSPCAADAGVRAQRTGCGSRCPAGGRAWCRPRPRAGHEEQPILALDQQPRLR